MSAMATTIELSSRNTRTDFLNEAKASRTYGSPLSDASNKSTDTSLSSSLIIEESIRNPSKTVSMISPKPFSRDKPTESRRSIGIGMPFSFSGDVRQLSDVPFQATTSISLSGSAKNNESERVGRRIFTTDKSEGYPPIAADRRKTSPSWPPGTNIVSEFKPTLQTDEKKVTSKPPLMSRKPELSQQEKVYPSYSRRNLSDASDKSREAEDKNQDKSKPENIDSLTVRAQLRQKRRPVSAVFLEANDPVSDPKVADEPKKWNRRPLSEDLTSLFESKGTGDKNENPSEETKENRPFKRSSFHSRITDEASTLDPKDGDYASDKSFISESRTGISGISSRNPYSARMDKDKTKEMPSNKQQQIADVGENEGIMKLSANINNQSSTFLPEQYDGSSGEGKISDESAIAPGIMKRRLGFYTASASSSEETEVPLNTESKSNANIEKTTIGFVSDKETKSETEWKTSPSPTATTDFTKKFFNSPSRYDMKSGKPNEGRRSSFSSQDNFAQKDKKNWQNSSLLEEKPFRQRSSIRRHDEPIQPDERTSVSKSRRDYSYKVKLYDAKTDASEEKDKNSVQVEKAVKTVKASMFEHTVERHSPPEVYHSENLISSKIPRSSVKFEGLQAKNESSNWSEWLTGDNVKSTSQVQKDLEITDSKFPEKNNSTEIFQGTTFQNLSKNYNNERVEPRYEVVQAIGERVLSESIEIAPEDKAVTLRSRRSFHNRDREMGKDGDARTWTSLQRSKSEYRKRNTLNSPQETSQGKFFSKDTDFPFERKDSLRTQKKEFENAASESLYKKERHFLSKNDTSNDGTNFTVKETSHEYYNRNEKSENTLGKYSSEYSNHRDGAAGKGESKTSFRRLSQKTDKSIGSDNSISKDFEKGLNSVKENTTIVNSNARDQINSLTQIKESNRQSLLNQFHPEKRLSTKNINKDVSNDFSDLLLNTEIEQIKSELFTRRSSKEADLFKEELKERPVLLKSHEIEKMSEYTYRTSDPFRPECDNKWKKPDEFRQSHGEKDNMDITAAKDPSPVDKRATYFAVTGMDGKKQRNDDSENRSISSNTNSASENMNFRHSVQKNTKNSNPSQGSTTKEETNPDKYIDNSHASKQFSTYNIKQDKIMETSEKSSVRAGSVIDVDALLKKHKQKSSVNDKGPSFLDCQTKPAQKSHFIENTQEANSKGSPLQLDGTYKTKVVDIDSLMADYNASQRKDKENKARDEDLILPKWERSRSFRESASKGSSSKWKDPSRHFPNEDGYKYEALASRYTSLKETTSTKDDLKQDLSKSSAHLDHLNISVERSHEREPYKGREVEGPVEPSVKALHHKAQVSPSFESRTTETMSISQMQSKQIQVKTSGDDEKENQMAEREKRSNSCKTSIPDENTLSEDKKPAKASDLINLMLENREKRREQLRFRQSGPVELPQEPKTHRLVTRQDWAHSESKEFHKTEEIKQYPRSAREMEFTTDLPRRKSRTEYTVSSNKDHVKQCFSRSSTSNKDTDSLVQETDRQYGTWSQDKQQPGESIVHESPSYENISSRKPQSHSRLSSLTHTETDQHDSITEAREGSLDRSSMDLDSTDGTPSTPSFHEAKGVDFSFMDQTSVLDSTALKNRVQLSRKSQRRAPSQTQRRSRLLVSSSQLEVIEDTDSPWMFTDSTEDKPDKKDEVDGEEEKPQRTSLPSQRMPMFPGMDHSTLMAQLRKRQEAESSSESSTQPSSPQTSAQPSRSPKSPLPQGTLGVKLLPTTADIQDRGASSSPQWLKELKSKKRLSQYENNS
ncbi:uncharacterized protein KIAA1671 homolog [Engystomops pustulosus]|uniref:uncharacterized protein KIAA1671 homolog n=1 Tax=Engystomops pustulosus TaxID=76066 RepID=UPI003AFA7B7C